MSDERDSYRVRKSSGKYSGARGGRGNNYADGGRQVRRERDYRQPPRKRPQPLMFRLLSWIGVILFFFVGGYIGTSWLMGYMNTRSLLKPDNRVRTVSEFESLNEMKQASLSNADQFSLTLYYVEGDSIVNSERTFSSKTHEDNIAASAEAVIKLSGIGSGGMKVLHVFRNGETVYLDMPGEFVSALSDAGQMKALRLLTAIVRTMQDNFPPVVRVKFLVDSKAPEPGGTVDLSVPWQLPSR